MSRSLITALLLLALSCPKIFAAVPLVINVSAAQTDKTEDEEIRIPLLPTLFKLVREEKTPLRPTDSFSENVKIVFKKLLMEGEDLIEEKEITEASDLFLQLTGLENIFYDASSIIREPIFKRGLCRKGKLECFIKLPSVQILDNIDDLKEVNVRIYKYGAMPSASLDFLPKAIKKDLDLYLKANTKLIKERKGQLIGYILYSHFFFDGDYPKKEKALYKHEATKRRFRYPLKYASHRIPLLAGHYLIEREFVNDKGQKIIRRAMASLNWNKYKSAADLEWKKLKEK